jgi:hypothetical protein
MAVDTKKIRERGVFYQLHECIDRLEADIESRSTTIRVLAAALLEAREAMAANWGSASGSVSSIHRAVQRADAALASAGKR